MRQVKDWRGREIHAELRNGRIIEVRWKLKTKVVRGEDVDLKRFRIRVVHRRGGGYRLIDGWHNGKRPIKDLFGDRLIIEKPINMSDSGVKGGKMLLTGRGIKGETWFVVIMTRDQFA